MLVVHPYNVLLASYVARNFPSWYAPTTAAAFSRVVSLVLSTLSTQALSP
jgi:hypothetical protein